MKQGRVVRRRRAGAFVVLIGLLSGLFGVVSPLADAAPVPPGVVGNFEIDGDQTSPAGGTIDWADVDPTVLTDSINPDDGLQGSSKEDEPEGFACQPKSPTVTPGKDNLVRAYINTRIASADSAFLDLGFVRSDGGTQGDSHVNFEFNQNPITNVCPYTGRTDGDLLITFDFPGNAADPAEVQTFAWDADAPDGSDAPGRWVSFEFTGSAAAEDNIADHHGPGRRWLDRRTGLRRGDDRPRRPRGGRWRRRRRRAPASDLPASARVHRASRSRPRSRTSSADPST